MPEKSDGALTQADRSNLSNYEPGYDWIPGRFGPPPGIPRERKLQLDKMTDRDFMAVVMRMGQEEKESLMISEAERLRTYKSLWPNPPFISYKDLAREGFYYTGVSDRVQCAFCAGFLGNWEAGDIPKQSHKQFFGYCKMVLRKPCANLPLSNDSEDVVKSLGADLLSTRADNLALTSLSELGITNSKPTHPSYSIYSTRLSTYRHYSKSYPMTPESLSEAGFFYEGPGDKVRCFWCDGALELWAEGDDVWSEHAKWYPGCSFIRQVKGATFVKGVRALMSADDLETSKSLHYNSSDTKFLDETCSSTDDECSIEVFDSYQVCRQLGFTDEELDKAFKLNNGADFSNVQVLLDILLAGRADNHDAIEVALNTEKSWKGAISADDTYDSSDETETLQPTSQKFLDVDFYLNGSPETVGLKESQELLTAMTCILCEKNQIGAVLLPCGHFVLCQRCSVTGLPSRCPVCKKTVRASCKTYLC